MTIDVTDPEQPGETSDLSDARAEVKRARSAASKRRWARSPLATVVLSFLVPILVGWLYYLLSNGIRLDSLWGFLFLGSLGVGALFQSIRQHALSRERELILAETKLYVEQLKAQGQTLQILASEERERIRDLGDAVAGLNNAQAELGEQMGNVSKATLLQAQVGLTISETGKNLVGSTNRIRRAVQRSESAIHLIQGASVLDSMSDIRAECVDVTERVLRTDWVGREEERREALRKAIRSVLCGLLRILRRWERFSGRSDADAVRYAANVMVYHEVAPHQMSAHPLRDALRFAGENPDFSKSQGFLQLRSDLAVWLCGRDKGRDDNIDGGRLFALLAPSSVAVAAWPKDKADRTITRKRFDHLPGASIAFGRRDADVFQRAAEIPMWCRAQSTLSEETGEEVARYFAEQHVGSIFSQFLGRSLRPGALPLTDGAVLDDGRKIPQRLLYRPLGVVNAHLDSPQVLPDNILAALCTESSLPLRTMLSHLLHDLNRHESETGDSE